MRSKKMISMNTISRNMKDASLYCRGYGKRRRGGALNYCIACAACLSLLFLSFCTKPRDYLLVVDTSGSMSTGERVIEKVKASMPAFMESVNEGDTITFATFDTDTQVRAVYSVEGDLDKENFIRQVEQLEALGAYTDMEAMILALGQLSRNIEHKDRELYIVVMSDGLDDPPPRKGRKGTLPLDIITAERPASEEVDQPYIYYISLGILKDPNLEEKLAQISADVTTLEDPEQLLGAVSEDIDTRRNAGIYPLVYLALAALFLAGFFIYVGYRFWNRHQLQGELLYYDIVTGPELSSTYRLNKLHRSQMAIGRRLGANLKIGEIALKQNLPLRATYREGEACLRPRRKDLPLFKFERQKRKNLISKGDRFQLSNMVFEYSDGE